MVNAAHISRLDDGKFLLEVDVQDDVSGEYDTLRFCSDTLEEVFDDLRQIKLPE